MLAFVSSLPHPENCVSYDHRCELFVATLGSMLRQTNRDIRVVLVANVAPTVALPDDPRVEVQLVPFDSTGGPSGRPSEYPRTILDRGAKLGVGATTAVAGGARYVMFVDSDDFVHREIAATVAESPPDAGWYFDAGFLHNHGAREVTDIDRDFHQRNGTSHVLRADLLGVPDALELGSRDDVLAQLGLEHALAIMGRHQPIVGYFAERGHPLAPFAYPAAIWEVGTGENASGVLNSAGARRPVAGAVSSNFGLPVPSRPTAARSYVGRMRARVAHRLAKRG